MHLLAEPVQTLMVDYTIRQLRALSIRRRHHIHLYNLKMDLPLQNPKLMEAPVSQISSHFFPWSMPPSKGCTII